MRITEKETRKGGRTVPVVELIPERLEGSWRPKCGIVGGLLVLSALALMFVATDLLTSYRVKLMILGFVVGGFLLIIALGRCVYRSVDHANIRAGHRCLGMTFWSSKFPMTHDLVLDMARNEEAELFVAIRQPKGDCLLSIGPFVDGDQAVKACTLMRARPRAMIEDGEVPRQEAAQAFRELEGAVSRGLSQGVMVVVFLLLLIPAWNDRTGFDAALSILLGVLVLIAGLIWIAPKSGVFYATDDGESVEYWVRQRLFHRLEFRKSLVLFDPPVFIRKRLHWGTLGWLLLIPVFISLVMFFLAKNA